MVGRQKQKPQKRGPPAILKVEEYKGKKVFTFTDLRVDQIDACDVMDNSKQSGETNIRVFRKGKLFDSGKATWVGTHGTTFYFCGLSNICPREDSLCGYEGRNLCASWFMVGDEIRFSCRADEVRKSIIKEWHYQIMFSSTYAEDMKHARKEQNRLVPILMNAAEEEKRQKKGVGAFLVGLEMTAVFTEVERQAFKTINARLAREPIPEIIRFCRSKLIKPNKDCP
mgnify:CR=1 FL=1